jgi:hypothetical protein
VFSTSLDNSTTPSAAGAKSLRPLFKCSLYNLQDTASRSKDVEIAEIYQYIDMAEWGGREPSNPTQHSYGLGGAMGHKNCMEENVISQTVN